MTFHFIITLMVPGGRQYTVEGTYDTSAGQTRREAYLAVLADVKAHLVAKGIDVSTIAVTFFSLEPNSLEVTR